MANAYKGYMMRIMDIYRMNSTYSGKSEMTESYKKSGSTMNRTTVIN